MKNLKGTKTAENLLKAFAGESQARNRYTYYATKAHDEGYQQIANVFLETADNEKEHAKRFFDFLCKDYHGEALLINADYPIGLDSTLDNLGYAAAGEHEEWSNLYPGFADIAEEEGFKDIAQAFRKISEVEMNHEARYKELYETLKSGQVFHKKDEVKWKCINCGYIHTGTDAPQICPTCLYKQAYFEVYTWQV